MQGFFTWLTEDHRIEPVVKRSYEAEFHRALADLIQRTKDPVLKRTFQKMIDCPIEDQKGQCRPFVDYIISAMIRQGVHNRYDMEAALGYVFEKMMLPKTQGGDPRATVFADFDETRPYKVGENPLQGRFLTYLNYAVNNIRQGKIPRLAKLDRPAGTVSIAQGRTRHGERGHGVSPESLFTRKSVDTDTKELIEDIEARLKPREQAYGLPLVDLFRTMLKGEQVRIGGRAAKMGKEIIARTIEDYAKETGNHQLLWLLRRLQHEEQKPKKETKPKPSEKDRDYASILSVIDRFERPVGTSELGKYRRRWLEYPPRNPDSGHRNRLEEVLSQMVANGVLKAVRGHVGGVRYVRAEKSAPVTV